jgi:hypothetical protein
MRRTWCLALALTACAGKTDEKQAAATEKVEPAPAAEAAPPPPPDAAPAKPAPVDPASFVEIAITGVPGVKATVKAPPGATVTPEAPGFNETEPSGAMVAAGDFALHVRRSTIGGERERARMQAYGLGDGVYTETKVEPGLVEFTAQNGGETRYGYMMRVEGIEAGKESVICGTAAPVATPEALEPYRAACATVAAAK